MKLNFVINAAEFNVHCISLMRRRPILLPSIFLDIHHVVRSYNMAASSAKAWSVTMKPTTPLHYVYLPPPLTNLQ
jgi:hypothetical protein